MKLTASAMKTLALPLGVGDKTYFDDDLPGFGVRLRDGGSRNWIVQYDFGGKTRKFTLGAVAALDLGEARKRAKDILAARTLGRDPAREKQEARVRASETFGALLPRYLVHKASRVRARSLKEIERHLVAYARPLHTRAVAGIDRRAVDALVSAITEKNGRVAAHNARASLSGYFDWLLRAGLLPQDANPVAFTNETTAGAGRDRVLTSPELSEVFRAASKMGDSDYGDIVKLLIYLPARRAEIGALRWDEIDFQAEEIRLPPARTKTGSRTRKTHVIPLAPAPLAILKTRQRIGDRPFVFGRGQSGFQGWSNSKAALDQHIADARKVVGVAELMPDFVVHDFRRTFSTIAHEQLGLDPHIIELVLGHAGHQTGVRARYNRATYDDQKRRALRHWAEHIEALIGGRKPGKVVKLRK